MKTPNQKPAQGAKRVFFWMPKLDLYVFREFLIPFSVLIFAFTILFLIGDVFNDADEFLEQENAALLAVRYFLLKIPGNIRFVLPITVLLSCMYTLANFGRHQEITAMRASGISLFRCGLPIYIIAFAVMLLNFWFNETVVPDCSQKAEKIMRTLKEESNELLAKGQSMQYSATDNLRNWVFGSFNPNRRRYRDVRLKFFEEFTGGNGEKERRLIRQLDAKEAEFVPGEGWRLCHCNVQELPENREIPFLEQCGVRDCVCISAEEAPETPELIWMANSDPDMLSVREIALFLRENPNLAERVRDIYATYFYQHLAFPWACFLCAFLALPLAAKNERSGVFLAIAIAVGVIVCYQILSELFLLLGKNGTLPPVIAGAFPTAAFALYGIFLARKAG